MWYVCGVVATVMAPYPVADIYSASISKVLRYSFLAIFFSFGLFSLSRLIPVFLINVSCSTTAAAFAFRNCFALARPVFFYFVYLGGERRSWHLRLWASQKKY